MFNFLKKDQKSASEKSAQTPIQTKEHKLSTEAYKGVRDFFPADMAVQNYIFGIWRKTAESFGYEEYGASVLEPAELYRAKSGEEIVNEQTYTFTDRGDRQVTLRPEMTPTVARMVAARKRELGLPLRWYSIPNLFRYEQPQRGRVREHWQLNVDMFGVDSVEADVELIALAYQVMKNFGAKDEDFEIRINNRRFMNYLVREVFEKLDERSAHDIFKLIDKKDKIPPEVFEAGIKNVFKNDRFAREFIAIMNARTPKDFTSAISPKLAQIITSNENLTQIKDIVGKLKTLGISNVRFDQTLMRGFDYYTGIVFEIFDTNPANRRSLFGGGRYDDLTSLFGGDRVPAVGFGMGDVTIRDFLETHGLLPALNSTTDIHICTLGEQYIPAAQDLAAKLRQKGTDISVNISVNLTHKKIGDQISYADKHRIPQIIVIGENEVTSGIYKIKNLSTGEETELKK